MGPIMINYGPKSRQSPYVCEVQYHRSDVRDECGDEKFLVVHISRFRCAYSSCNFLWPSIPATKQLALSFEASMYVSLVPEGRQEKNTNPMFQGLQQNLKEICK